MKNLKHRLAILAAICFVAAISLFRLAVDRETDKNLVAEVPVGEGMRQKQVRVNTEKLCYFELSRSIQLTAAQPGVLGDVADSEAAPENPLGHVIAVRYTVFDGDGQEILSDTHQYSVSEFSLESPVTAKLSALESTPLGRFVKIKPPGRIWVETDIVESGALTGFQFQSTDGGVSVWDNAFPSGDRMKFGGIVLITIGLGAMVGLVTEVLKSVLP